MIKQHYLHAFQWQIFLSYCFVIGAGCFRSGICLITQRVPLWGLSIAVTFAMLLLAVHFEWTWFGLVFLCILCHLQALLVNEAPPSWQTVDVVHLLMFLKDFDNHFWLIRTILYGNMTFPVQWNGLVYFFPQLYWGGVVAISLGHVATLVCFAAVKHVYVGGVSSLFFFYFLNGSSLKVNMCASFN